MKRCLKLGVGGYEKIREKFPKITSCNQFSACSLLNTIFHIEINKTYGESFFFSGSNLGKKRKSLPFSKNSMCKFGSIRVKECITV